MRGIYAFIVLSLVSMPALGQGASWYIGGGITGTDLETSGGEVSDTAFGGQIFVGVMLDEYSGVELKYNDSGDAEDTISGVDVEVSIDGLTFYYVVTLPFSDKWGGSLKFGLHVRMVRSKAAPLECLPMFQMMITA